MMDTADKMAQFFLTPKRQLAPEKWIDHTLEGEQRKKLEELSR